MLGMYIRMSNSPRANASSVARAVAASAEAIAAVPANVQQPAKVRTFFNRAKSAMRRAKAALKNAGSYLSRKAGNAGRFLSRKARNAHNRVLGGRVNKNSKVFIPRTRLGNALNRARGYRNRALSATRKGFGRAYSALKRGFKGLRSRFSRRKVLSSQAPRGEQPGSPRALFTGSRQNLLPGQ